jgi:4-amino-4-deoxy-L-arabinose transferase-like glycosyltransferase
MWLVLSCLLAVQAAEVVTFIHRESLTWDEGDHSFAGYMMLHAGDYGLNPEHPPLVKMLAAVPTLGRPLWTPPIRARFFKTEAYLDGRDWLERNDGASQHLLFAMRLCTVPLALALTLVVFFAARECFGPAAALVAATLVVFDPCILANSGVVTTDIAISLFLVVSLYAYYRYVKQPSAVRLVLAGVAMGLLLASKHSGILVAPMLVALAAIDIFRAPRALRLRQAVRLAGALAAMAAIAVAVLWAFYGFRYAARPAGLVLNPTLAEYVKGLNPFSAGVVLLFARLHLLPESYLMGLVDVKVTAQFYPAYILGRVHAHGVWYYFPVVMLSKWTLGLLGLIGVTVYAALRRRLRMSREVLLFAVPAIVYLAIAMAVGMDIGARHLMPVLALATILAGAGVAAMAQSSQRWAWAGAALVALHVGSALAVFPHDMAYANEAWGGPKNTHLYLSDANVDWAQQLIQVKEWQDRHPNEDCWFAYFAYPEIRPEEYGIRCKHLPNADTGWMGGADLVPASYEGTVLLSAGDLSGTELPDARVNPYQGFQPLVPDETIEYGVFVYRGRFGLRQAAAMSRAQRAWRLLGANQPQQALALAREGVGFDPEEINCQTARGDAAAALGQKDEARAAWTAAIAIAGKMEPDAQPSFVPDLEAKLGKL